MAIEAQLADGRILEFPDGTDPSIIQATVKRIVAQSATPKESTIGSELVRGGKQLVSSARTGIGSIFNPEEAAKAGVARSEAIGQEAGVGPSLEAVQKAYQKDGVLSAAGEAASQIPRALAGQGANLTSLYAASKAGAAAGAPFGARGRIVGGAAGAAGSLLPQFMGANVERQAAEQMDEGKDVSIDRTKAYTAAAGQAALESAGTAFVFGKRVVKGILGIADDAALATAKSQAELVKAAERSLAATAGRGALRGTAEMPVEVAQQVLERYQAGLDVTSPDAIKEYGESAYQAALIGGPLGAAGNVVGRGQARDQVEQQQRAEAASRVPPKPEPEPEVVPGAKIPEEAPVGEQGALFTPKEMGKKVKEPQDKQEPTPETFAELTAERDRLQAEEQTPEVRAQLDAIKTKLAPKDEGQLTLGIDFQRDYIDLFKERDRLREGEQTPEVKARIAELTEQLKSYDEADIGQRQAEKIIKEEKRTKEAEQKAADDAAAQRFPGLAGPTTAVITQADIDAMGLPLRTSKQWITDNVIGKTVEEIKALVAREPKLISGKGARADVLKTLIAPEPKAFEEKPSDTTTTQTDQPQGELDLGGGESGVGISDKPTGTDVVQPGAGVSTTTGTSATPDGLGLAPAGQPASTGTDAQGAQPTAVTATRTADQVMDEMRVLREEQQALLTSAGKRPAVKSKARARWDAITDQLSQKMAEWTELDKAERTAKGPNAPATTPAATGAPATTTTTTGPQTTTGTTDAATTPKKGKARPAPAAPKVVNPFAGLIKDTGDTETTVDEETPAPKGGTTDPYAWLGDAAAAARARREAKEKAEAERKAEEAKKAAEAKKAKEDKAKAEAKRKADEAKKAEEERKAEEKRKADEAKAEAKRKADEAKKAAEEAAAAAAAKQASGSIVITPTWSKSTAEPLGPIVYEDADFALVRRLNKLRQPRYYAVNRQGRTARYPIQMQAEQPSWLTGKDYDRLKDAGEALTQKESDLAAKNPNGPFTGKANVVGADEVNPAVVGYAEALLKSLGLGDLRVFLFSQPDAADSGYIDKHKLFGRFAHLADPQESKVNGSATTVGGPAGKTYGVYLKPGMSENKQIEILAHEIGHIVQTHLYDNATTAEQKAITNEYLAWRKNAKLATKREFFYMLRNREDATENVGIAELNGDADAAASTIKDFNEYWSSFSEWFADNVSRWATTNKKPLSIADKFFAKTAQMMRDLVAIVTGRKFPPAKSVADFLNAAGPANFTPNITSQPKVEAVGRQFSISYGAESLIDTLGPLNKDERSTLTKWVDQAKSEPDIGYVTKFRTQVADIAATIEKRLSDRFDGAVRDKMGKLNPMGLYRQAQDYTKMLLEYFQTGTLYKDKATGLWMSGQGEGVRPPVEVYALIDKYAEKNGYSRERATQIASRVLEGVRLNEMRRSNRDEGTEFLLHLSDADIDLLMREYNADPDLQEMSKLMDEARIAMVDNMVKVGRLSAEEGKLWREVSGYVPFDRETIDNVSANFNKVKKISGKGLSQVGKLPELVGSLNRPVGNVFDNYINTLGWMVGQTLKTDATVQTLRSLEDIGTAKFLGRSAQGNPNVVDAYVDGEKMYWSVPSKYDVMAFKDLNPPKAGWLRNMGAFSNILRKTVTVLPPFALKQVTDDVQRAILTSGVRNPGALIWMSLTNFPRLALAELRGIQHPMVKDFGRLGLTGEYDFEAGKPATSLLKDLGYKKRGKFETLIHRLDGITRASDLAVRKAIYDQTMKESGDALLAQTRAREFINFRRRGSSDFVGAMVTTIPFFNAYIQGMDVLYRAASGKDSSSSVDRAQARRLFWSRASTVFMLSSLYALGMDDEDEDYNEMDLRTRDGNWILPGGYKLPVPGELGALFKVIPERIVEYMKRQGTPEEQTAFEAVRTTLTYMFEQYVGRAVPVPQAIKPVMEAWANKSFLTGRDLEGYHHKAMDPSARVNEQTSELAKAIAVFSRDQIGVEVSPIMIDNTLRGYFGSSAAMLTMVTDSLLNPTRVDRPLHKYALLSTYLYDPVGTRRMAEFYDQREKVGKANTTLNELMKTDLVRAEKYAEEHADELMLESAVNSTLEQLERTRAYRKFLNSSEGADQMSKADREAELKEVKQMEMEFVKWVREAQTELRKAQ